MSAEGQSVIAANINAENIAVYTYHTHPPFITGTGQGLSYDLAEYLSEKSQGRYKFTVKPMSKPRVGKMLAEKKNGIIPWVNPVWFKDEAQKKYLWTNSYIMEDSNAFISHKDLSLVYEGPDTLKNLVFGGVRAHVYFGIDDFIKTGKARRVDAENHVDNFRKLKKRRIDATITPSSGAKYLIMREELEEDLFISPKPHSTFKRRVIIINKSSDLLLFINSVVDNLANDKMWRDNLEKYQ